MAGAMTMSKELATCQNWLFTKARQAVMAALGAFIAASVLIPAGAHAAARGLRGAADEISRLEGQDTGERDQPAHAGL